MVFTPPAWVPNLPFEPPDSVTIEAFVMSDRWGRHPLHDSRPPFTCGLSGREYPATDIGHRVDALSRSLAHELDWKPNRGKEWDKVMGVFTHNTIDFLILSWAVHRLSGLCMPVSAAYSVTELAYQLKDSGATSLFTCAPLLSVALKAANQIGLPLNRICLFDVPDGDAGGESVRRFQTLEGLTIAGFKMPPIESLQWSKGQGARQTAYLCYSSGTSGLPKGVMISHRNVIANVLQIKTFEHNHRQRFKPPGALSDYTDVVLDVLPQSHIYGLVYICHAAAYRGDQIIVLPKFSMEQVLGAIQKYHINSLFLVPPIITSMAKDRSLLSRYDLSSVHSIITGAAPLGAEIAEQLSSMYPGWYIRQGYGMQTHTRTVEDHALGWTFIDATRTGLTETSTVVSGSVPDDLWFGSSGSLVPGYEARLVSADGKDIHEYNQPGELLLRSPSIVLGYFKNEKANKEAFEGPWLRTGDEAVVKESPNGNQHIWIVDRLKELIKVKGNQVAPAELEAHLLAHPYVADCAVIGVPDEEAGERPKAFVKKSAQVSEPDLQIAKTLHEHVQSQKARYKWLVGGIEFVDAIPRSASGKILRREMRDREKAKRRKGGML